MARAPIPSYFFALVVVRRGSEFLLVHERKHGQGWYIPAGRVEIGETFVAAAERETLEEAGIPGRVDGIVRIEHAAEPEYSRVRVIFTASPVGNKPLKSVPDDESLEAKWVRLGDLGGYPLRGEGVKELLEYVEGGGAVYPVDLIQIEGARFG